MKIKFYLYTFRLTLNLTVEGCEWCVGGWGVLVDVGVESVDGVSCVVHGPDGAVGFGEGVAALDDISVTAFSLTLGVSGQRVLDAVGEGVGRVWVVAVQGWSQDLGVARSHNDGGEDDELKHHSINEDELVKS